MVTNEKWCRSKLAERWWHKLPEDYVAGIEGVEAVEDPEAERESLPRHAEDCEEAWAEVKGAAGERASRWSV